MSFKFGWKTNITAARTAVFDAAPGHQTVYPKDFKRGHLLGSLNCYIKVKGLVGDDLIGFKQ